MRRIVALLAALADFAERAAVRSCLVRWLVFLILRRAEIAAEAFVLEATGMPPFTEEFAAAGNGPEDALRLATRFRALATALAALLPVGLGRVRRNARRGVVFGRDAKRSRRAPGDWSPIPNDTS